MLTKEAKSTRTMTRTTDMAPPLHTANLLPHTHFTRLLAAVYFLAILVLLYHHVKTLTTSVLYSFSLLSFFITLTLLLSDFVLAFMWINTTALRLYPIKRKEYSENIKKVIDGSEFPCFDIFICTADPYKEPPMGVVNTALSVMAYDYVAEKLSVYVSDDGGSIVTLFAFFEAAKFARHWLPFCRENNFMETSPDAFFESEACQSRHNEIKVMYQSIQMKVEHVLENGKVPDEYITSDEERQAFNKWTANFTRQDHPTVIQVLLCSSKDRDVSGHLMPNLIYVSRQKSRTSPHHFKAGALNTLLRVSATMTNAPMILTLDCDMCSNDSGTLQRAMCYLCDPAIETTLAYVQFPQRYRGLNKHDIYAGEYKRLFHSQSMGFDGLMGPNYVGTGCFFRRRAFFGGTLTPVSPDIRELGPAHVVNRPIQAQSVLALAHQVASCNYENKTHWGSKIGFRYGSLVEDYYTGYRLQCEGWRSVLCYPERAAFLGDAPICLIDMLNQQKRWSIGLLEVAFSRYCPLTYGVKSMGLLMGLGYAQYSFWAFWSIPITIYAFLPQLALLNKVVIFPKVMDPLFLLYGFMFLGAYGQDYVDFIITGGTFQKWWNDQRTWSIRGVTCYLFGTIEYTLKQMKISTSGFNVTSKVIDEEQSKRYEQGKYEFGVHSPMFVTLTMAAIINLIALVQGLVMVFFAGQNWEALFMQVLLSGFVVVNCLPVYEAMVLRRDDGRIPIYTSLLSIFFAWLLYLLSSLILKSPFILKIA